jgi:small GTP-binding protein
LSLVHLEKLEHLELEGNPLTSPPPEVVVQGLQAVLAYLREQLEAGRRQWVSKLLVVGEGGVGKTALLRSLRGEPFDPQLSSTHGIQIDTLELAHPREEAVTIELNAWDFGGQEIYHATHQFFLTNRSLFLLAWNARHGYEQGKLYYWLDAIQARAPESPVILVATHLDQRDADLPLTELRTRYPQIAGHCEISNKTGQGIEELRAALTESAASLPLMGQLWPAVWLDAAEEIRGRPEKHISPRELYEIMAAHNVTGYDADVLGLWLHELGDLLYFREDEELNDLVILKPQWVTEYISEVLESEEVIGRLGIFTREHMAQLWGDLDPAMRDHFLRLMERFDLSYRTLENREISLVVERLPLDPPTDLEAKWTAGGDVGPCQEIAIKYRLNTIPAGIPTWFIARSHRFTTYTHWRNGALFAYTPEQRHLALARALPHDRYLELLVRGPTPQNFFALLKDGIEVTLSRFPGLKIDRMIPCPGHDGQPCSHEFKYEQLEKRLAMKPPRYQVECPEALEFVDVRTLLFGLDASTLDDVLHEVREARRENTERHDELLALLQREFAKGFEREQSKIESHCPNTFVLRPIEMSTWRRLLRGGKMQLQLYCQYPGRWHPTALGGKYTVPDPADFLVRIAPYLQRLVDLLKFVTPFVGPWVGMANEAYSDLIKNDIKFMNELVEALPETLLPGEVGLAGVAGERLEAERVGGAPLRALRKLLDEVDPQHEWGGLQKVLTPEGHYLWLCEYHAKEYAT